MKDLEKRITGDWIDLREASLEYYSLRDFFKLPVERLHRLRTRIESCAEGGLLEYKDGILKPVFLSLEEMKFQNPAVEKLETHLEPLRDLLFAILLQRLLCLGSLPSLKAQESPSPLGEVEGMDPNRILGEIKERVRLDPELQKHPAVKNIYVQLAIYTKEKKKMEELLPNIKPDKQAVFKENFQGLFAQVSDSIRKNYAALLSEERSRRFAERAQEDLFHRLPVRGLAAQLAEQAREISRLRSTLAFVLEDKYKTRDHLVRLHQEREGFLKLLEKEQGSYGRLCAEAGKNERECPREVSARFRDELGRLIDRIARAEDSESS